MLTFKDFVAFSFNKKRAKGYLLSAFLLAFSAIFVRTTIYYTIVATLLVVFAIISQFNTTFNIKESILKNNRNVENGYVNNIESVKRMILLKSWPKYLVGSPIVKVNKHQNC